MFGFLKPAITRAGERRELRAKSPVNAPPPAVDDEIPRYPPFMKGLPATPPEKLIETQRALIDQMRDAGRVSPERFAQFHLASLRRFASYAHLLPASETHHHRGAGGLLRHAAEVALWSLQSGDRLLLPGEQTPRRRRELEPRWQLAVFLAGLCHDLGKPVTDLVVTPREGTPAWNPFVEDLFAWAQRNRVDRYFLHWRAQRGRKHQTISAWIAERIIGAQGLAWIAEGDTELVLWMMETISGSPSAGNPIHDLVVRSDALSVARDLRRLGVAFSGHEIGLPVERFLLDLMRRLVREGTWTLNRPGARLWCLEGHLYLIWPAAGEDLAALFHQEGIPGLPRTPDSLLEMLVDRNLLTSRGDRAPGSCFWLIAPSVLAAKIPGLRLTAIRLRDAALILDPPPLSVPGKILDEAEGGMTPESPVPTLLSATEPLATPDAPPAGNPGSEPLVPPADRLDGVVGEALMALARDLRSGERSADTLIHLDAAGGLCLKWPEALNGCPLESKAILDELSRRNWLAIDPLSPFRKVTEIEVDKGNRWKVIRLQPVVREWMAIGTLAPAVSVLPTPAVEPPPSPTPEPPAGPGEDERLPLIQAIVATLHEAMREGWLTGERDDSFVWIPSRKAEPWLVERLPLRRAQILRLGSVAPEWFLCQTRHQVHCYRLPVLPEDREAPPAAPS